MAKECPKCQRPNNDRAVRCIYCGDLFPEVSAPAPGAKTAPADAPTPKKKAARPPLESYQVIVSPLQQLDDKGFSAFAGELNLDAYTAGQKLKHPAPWIARAFPTSEDAQAMVKRLAAMEVDSYVVKQSGVDKIMSPVQAAGLKSMNDDGIVFLGEGGEEIPILFADVLLLIRGRIKERPDREDDLEEERPSVNIGKMAYGPDEDREGEKSRLQTTLEQISVKVRPTRMRWVLRAGLESETVDLYHKNSHRAVRIIENEFDYSGLGDKMVPSSLLNFNAILKHLGEHLEGVPVDSNFDIVGYTFTEAPKEDQTRSQLESVLAASDSAKKMFDNQTFFSEYSARIYLHHLRQRSRHKGPAPATERPPITGMKFKSRYQNLGIGMVLLCAFLIFVQPVLTFVSITLSVMRMWPYLTLFADVTAVLAADALLGIAVAAFGIHAGAALVVVRDNALRAARTFLMVFIVYYILTSFVPFLTDLTEPAREAALIEAGLEPALKGGMQLGDFLRLLLAAAFFGVSLFFLGSSRRVREIYGSQT